MAVKGNYDGQGEIWKTKKTALDKPGLYQRRGAARDETNSLTTAWKSILFCVIWEFVAAIATGSTQKKSSWMQTLCSQ